jgi:hypothetical protein
MVHDDGLAGPSAPHGDTHPAGARSLAPQDAGQGISLFGD